MQWTLDYYIWSHSLYPFLHFFGLCLFVLRLFVCPPMFFVGFSPVNFLPLFPCHPEKREKSEIEKCLICFLSLSLVSKLFRWRQILFPKIPTYICGVFVHTCIFVCYTLSLVAIYMCPILTFIREQPQWKTHTFVNIFIGKDIPMHPCYQLKFQPPQTFDFHTRTSLLFKGHTRETQLWSQICLFVHFGKTLHWFNGKCWCFSFLWWNFAWYFSFLPFLFLISFKTFFKLGLLFQIVESGF